MSTKQTSHSAHADQAAASKILTLRQKIVNVAKQQIGTPYHWGGGAPGGFDCSGLVQYVLGQDGIHVEHYSGLQYQQGSAVNAASIQPGDIVFTRFDSSGVPQHEGIYVGKGMIIDAPHTGDNVKYESLDTWKNHYGEVAFRRYGSGANATPTKAEEHAIASSGDIVSVDPNHPFQHVANASASPAQVRENLADVAQTHGPQNVYSSPGSEPKIERVIQSGKTVYHGGAPVTDVDYSTNKKGQLVTQTHTASGAVIGEVYNPATGKTGHPYVIKPASGTSGTHDDTLSQPTHGAGGTHDDSLGQPPAGLPANAHETPAHLQQVQHDIAYDKHGHSGHNPQDVYPMGPASAVPTHSQPPPPIFPDPGPPPPSPAHGAQAEW